MLALQAPSRSLRLRDAIRWVFFETDQAGWEYAWHGGTLFVVLFRGVPYGITAKHNRHDFSWQQLCVTNQRVGWRVAAINGIYYPTVVAGAHLDSDLGDVAVVEFGPEVGAAFFGGSIYQLEERSISLAGDGDNLTVYGVLSDQSSIDDRSISPSYATLGMEATRATATDPVLGHAIGQWRGHAFKSISGISGAPIFNESRGGLTGMVVRGTLQDNGVCNVWYVSIPAILTLLSGISDGQISSIR